MLSVLSYMYVTELQKLKTESYKTWITGSAGGAMTS
jgi:hypothetical protein